MAKEIRIEPGKIRDAAEKLSSCVITLQSVEAELKTIELPAKLEQQNEIGVRLKGVASRLEAAAEKAKNVEHFLSGTAEAYERVEERLLAELDQLRQSALSAEEERLKKLEDQFF